MLCLSRYFTMENEIVLQWLDIIRGCVGTLPEGYVKSLLRTIFGSAQNT